MDPAQHDPTVEPRVDPERGAYWPPEYPGQLSLGPRVPNSRCGH